jgi:hypothetical protein
MPAKTSGNQAPATSFVALAAKKTQVDDEEGSVDRRDGERAITPLQGD